MKAEKWKLVPGYPYLVSSYGRVKRVAGGRGAVAGRILACSPNGKGYPAVKLFLNGKPKHTPAHLLVASAFVANPLNLPEVNHKDGNPGNPRYKNLEWVTRKQNVDHAYQTGLIDVSSRTGERHFAAKLTVKSVKFIRRSGMSSRRLAKLLGVSRSTIQSVLKRRSWNCV